MSQKKFPNAKYMVVFTNKKTKSLDGYSETNNLLEEKVKNIAGYEGLEFVSNSEGESITISYWNNKEGIEKWRLDTAHQQAKLKGMANWYEYYNSYIAEIIYANFFTKEPL